MSAIWGMRERRDNMEHDPQLAVLARTELFRGAPPETLRAVQSTSVRKRFATGETVFCQGDAATTLYVVVVGRLRATQTTPDGQQVIIRYLGPGEVAGYAALSGGAVHPGTVTAVDDSHLLAWDHAVFKEIMAGHSVVALNAIALLGARYHDLQVRLRELSTQRVEQRIAHTILRLAEKAGRRTARGIEIAFPLSRQDLAEMSATTLHTVSRTLSAWEEQGIVDCGRRRVIVVNADALALVGNGRR
ncbi:MAG TPA: Crp/Fnr family transcriptional regulator [Xanthobacteraceae bacterium]|nr:Crp/Fnr family transcriptional regulator [Xanthobacteraceae bacterium]